jgi:hypothetical protein
MYRRKIGKKIFRRTRKHKFYGIKAKNRPSLITRRRVRRGGEGEEADVHSVIGNYASRSIFLNKEKCKTLLMNAIGAQNNNPDRDIKYTPNALGDKKYCDDKYGTFIDDNVSRVREHQLEEQRKQKEKDDQEEKRQLEEQQKQREIDEQEQKRQLEEEQQQRDEQDKLDEQERLLLVQKRDLELQQQIQSNITPEEERKQQKQQLKEMLEQQLKSENKNTTIYIDNPGFKKFTAKNNHYLFINFARYKGRLSLIYDLIYGILKLIIFNKQHFFINKLSENTPGIITIAGTETSVYIEVIKKLSNYTEKYNDFIIYYNSAVSEPEKFEIGEAVKVVGSAQIKIKKIVKDPKFLDMEKVLKLLYNFYDICLTNYVFYSLYIQILSYRLINLGLEDDEIIDISNINNAVSKVFRPLYLEYKIDNSILSTYDSDTLNDKKQNDINQLCYRLVHPLTPTEYDSKMNYEEPLQIINIQKNDQGYVEIQDPSFLINIPNVLSELENIWRNNLKHKDEFTQVVELNRQFTSFETPTVINTKYTKYPTYDLYYFDMIDNIHNFLMKYNDIFCFSSSWFRGKKTEMDVRRKIQAILTPLVTDKKFDKLEFADYLNPDTFNPVIMEQIIQLLNDNTVATKTCQKRIAVIRFTGYTEKYKQDTNSKPSYFLKIFLNMIIYACYYQRLHGDEKVWNRKGTDLMIIFMNLFILQYLENILSSISDLLDQQIDRLLAQKDTYIFYDKMFTFIIPRVEEIRKNIETINLKKNVTFRKSVEYGDSLKFLPSFKLKYRSIKEQIDSHNLTVLGLMKFNEYNNPYVNPEKDKSVDKPPTLLKTMIGITLFQKNIDICSDVTRVLSSQELLSDRAPTPNPTTPTLTNTLTTTPTPTTPTPTTPTTPRSFFSFLYPKDMDEDIRSIDSPHERKEQCKLRLADIINLARVTPNNDSLMITPKQINDMEVCSDFEDVFSQKDDGVSREYYKRIARAYYGIKEILLKADIPSKRLIKKIPNVIHLFKEVENNKELRNKLRTQCITDKDKEDKGALINALRLMKTTLLNEDEITPIRQAIRANLTDAKIDNLCNITFSDVGEDVDAETTTTAAVGINSNPELEEYYNDLKEGAKLANENARLRQQSAEENRKIIEDLKKYNSKEEMLADAKNVYKGLHSSIRAEIDAALNRKGSGFFSSLLPTGGSKRRSKTIKRRRRQQKQHKTKKYGRKYRAPRPNKKTRKHLGPHRSRPHHRTRSH